MVAVTEEEEPAWIDAARFISKVWRHPKTHSTLFIFSCTCVLTVCSLHTGTYYTPTGDVIVYCLIYSLWLTLCLPWLVKNLDRKTLVLVAGVLLRLFAAEAGVLAWGLCRGHGHFLQRALRLRPLLEPSLMWLVEAGYNLRYGVIISSAVAATLVTVSELLHSSNRKPVNSNRDPSSVAVRREDTFDGGCKPASTKSHHEWTCKASTGGDLRENEHPALAGDKKQALASSVPDCWCSQQRRDHGDESPDSSPESPKLVSFSRSPHKSRRKRMSSTGQGSSLRKEMGDSTDVQASPPQMGTACCHQQQQRKCVDFEAGLTSDQNKMASHLTKATETENRLPGHGFHFGCSFKSVRQTSHADDMVLLANSSQEAGNGRVRQSSSCASSLTSDNESRQRRRQARGRRPGFKSSPAESTKFSPKTLQRDRKVPGDKRISREKSAKEDKPRDRLNGREQLKPSVRDMPDKEMTRREFVASGGSGKSCSRLKRHSASADRALAHSGEKKKSHHSHSQQHYHDQNT